MKCLLYASIVLTVLLFSPVVEAMEEEPVSSKSGAAHKARPPSGTEISNLVTRDTVKHIRKWAGVPEDWRKKSTYELTQFLNRNPVEKGSFRCIARQGFKSYTTCGNLSFIKDTVSEPIAKTVELLREGCKKWGASGKKLKDDNPLKPLADQAYKVIMFEDKPVVERYLKEVLSCFEEVLKP